MNWRTMRDEFKRRLDEQPDLTQEVIAETGGLKRQNLVSKMLKNNHLGPQVETFVRAITGLGLQPSEFFAELERRQTSADSNDSLKSVTKRPIPSAVHGSHTVRAPKDDLKPIVDEVLFRISAAVGDAATGGHQKIAGQSARTISKSRGKQRTGGKKGAADR